MNIAQEEEGLRAQAEMEAMAGAEAEMAAEAAQAESEEVRVVLEDGAVVNLETGEVYGYEGQPFVLPPLDDVARATMTKEEILQATQERESQLRAAVLWATERRAKAEAKKKGLEAEMEALVKGIQSRFGALIKEQANKLAWLDAQYRPAMMEFTASELVGSKSKSVKLPWATLAFRATKGKLEVVDAPMAAYSLLEEGLEEAVTVTLTLGELKKLADEDSLADVLLESAREALKAKFLPPLEEGGDVVLSAVECLPGVSVAIQGAKVPDVIPKGAKGLTRAKPDHPLGDFSVKH